MGHGRRLRHPAALRQPAFTEVAKPAWWNDEDLKALSARVVRAAPNDGASQLMRAIVLCGMEEAWEASPRSAAELKEAAMHCERVALLAKGQSLSNGASCRGSDKKC